MTEDEGDLTQVRRCVAIGCKGPDGQPRHLHGADMVCRGCAEHGHTSLMGLPLRYVHLRMSLRSNGTEAERVSGGLGFASASPVRDAALNAMADIAGWSLKMDTDVRQALRMTTVPNNGFRDSVGLVRSVVNIHRQYDRILPMREGVAVVNGANYWSRLANVILGWDRLVHQLPAPCPYCDTVTLIRRDGDNVVRCRRCHRTWMEAEYRHFVKMLIEEVT